MPATDALVEGEIGSVEESSPGQHHPSTLSCGFVLRQRTYQAKLAGLGQVASPSMTYRSLQRMQGPVCMIVSSQNKPFYRAECEERETLLARIFRPAPSRGRLAAAIR